MTIPLTFLRAHMPLAKEIGDTPDATKSYPLAKRFTSFHHPVEPTQDGLKQFEKHLRTYSAIGACFFKGELKRQLQDEPRAKMAKKNEPNQVLVIDIDKFETTMAVRKFDQATLEGYAETIIKMLPNEFHKVSYIVQASASLGLKPNQVSFHLFFFMDEPVPPAQLKWYLTHLNLATKFNEQLSLSPVGHVLTYPIDICSAQNSRIIYIAPPKFTSKLIANPFPDPEDRIVLVEKDFSVVQIAAHVKNTTPQEVQTRVDEMIHKMREKAGLKNNKAKVKMMKVDKDGVDKQVLTNPDQATMTFAGSNDQFAYANLNGGDSNAYFWPLDNPRFVYNFKGEPIFEMSKVDPDFYVWYLEEFREHLVSDAKLKPLVFRDFKTDTYYTVVYDPTDNRMERFASASRQALEDFCLEYWEPMPEPLPTWDVFFNPAAPAGIDFDAKTLNLFSPTEYMIEENDLDIDPKFSGLEYGDTYKLLMEACPNIAKLMFHIVGSSMREFEHFFNWLAFVFVKREKTSIAWIMHGVEGTGKGQFYNRVIMPLFGSLYSTMKRMNDLEDNFDGWREYNLVTAIDEFKLSDSSMAGKMYDKIKNMISEPYGTVRYMRANPKDVPMYSNYLFFTNNEDAMRLSATDRRFCVAIRQTQKLSTVHPEILEILNGIEPELKMFSKMMIEMNIDMEQARVALDNSAKQEMRNASNSWVDDFCYAVTTGDYAFFLENVMFFEPKDTEGMMRAGLCKRAVASWAVYHMQHGTSLIPLNFEDLRNIYSMLSGREARMPEFQKVLARRAVQIDSAKVDGRSGRWIWTEFNFAEYDMEEFMDTYVPPDQAEDFRKQLSADKKGVH